MYYSRFKDKGGTSICRWNVVVCWLLFHWLKKHFTHRNLSLILYVINYYILSIDLVIVCDVKQETRSWLWPTAAVQDIEICRYMLYKLCILGKQQSFRWCLSVETPLSYWNCQLLFIKIRGGGFGECAAIWMWQVRTSATEGRRLSFLLARLKCTKDLWIAADSLHLHLGCEPPSPSAQATIR